MSDNYDQCLNLVRSFFAIQIKDYFNGIRAHDICKNKTGGKKEGAIEEYRGHATRALQWIRNKENYDVFSFESICKILEIDPGKMRKKLLAISKPQHVEEVMQNTSEMESFGVIAARRMREYEKKDELKILGIHDL